jgi:F0F1-type ATP synthase epsilon subunit
VTGMRTFSCEILEPGGPVWAGQVFEAVIPATDGQFAIRAGRLPVIVPLGAGALTLADLEGDKTVYFVDGGIARMDHNGLCVMARQCMAAAALDRKAVWDEMADANAMPRETDEQDAARQERLSAMRSKFKLAQAFGKR